MPPRDQFVLTECAVCASDDESDNDADREPPGEHLRDEITDANCCDSSDSDGKGNVAGLIDDTDLEKHSIDNEGDAPSPVIHLPEPPSAVLQKKRKRAALNDLRAARARRANPENM
jgi:hypothetical protein